MHPGLVQFVVSRSVVSVLALLPLGSGKQADLAAAGAVSGRARGPAAAGRGAGEVGLGIARIDLPLALGEARCGQPVLKEMMTAWKSPGTRPYAMSRSPLRCSVRVATRPAGSGTWGGQPWGSALRTDREPWVW